MSETPQTPQDWTKYWQEQGQYENAFAAPGTGQMPYGLFGDQLNQPYAGWWSRVGASLLDSLIGFLLACVGSIPVGILAAFTGNERMISGSPGATARPGRRRARSCSGSS